jgi:hypothetical protein
MIDTFKLATSGKEGFKLTDNPFLINPSQKPNHLFTFEGEPYKGKNAYYHSNLGSAKYSVVIQGYGMNIKFNPSKVMRENNFIPATESEVKKVVRMVLSDMKKQGVILDENQLVVSRVDLAKNVQLKDTIESYSKVFRLLNPKCMKKINLYEYESITFGNKSRVIALYDKTLEMKEKYGVPLDLKNILRCEQRFLKSSVVKSVFGSSNVVEFLKDGLTERMQAVYKKGIESTVYRIGADFNGQYQIDFDDNGLIEHCKSLPRGKMDAYHKIVTTPAFLLYHDNDWDRIDNVLEQFYPHKETRARNKRKIEEDIRLHSIYVKDSEVPKKYEELKTLLLSA